MKEMNVRTMSVQDLLHVGVDKIAYIKNEGAGYAVHAADGKPLVTMDSYPSAIAVVKQHDLHPVTVH